MSHHSSLESGKRRFPVLWAQRGRRLNQTSTGGSKRCAHLGRENKRGVMKVLESAIQSKNGCGFVRLQPEEEEDIYHLYNLLNKGDRIEALTMRNVVKESKSGARDRQRVLTKVEIEVEKIEFDAEQCSLRIKGTNVKENDFLKLGQYHTLELELNRPCRISKDRWDSIHMELIADISDPASKSEVAAIVIGEGLAHVCLLKASLTKTCARLERQLPKKRGQQGTQAYDAAVQKFFRDIYEAVKRHINFDIVKVVLVGSPGFLSEDFLQFVWQSAVREEDTEMLKNKSKFVKGHTSSGHKRAIDEMLSCPELVAQLENVRAADEAKALQDFYDMLAADPDRAVYGIKQVESANEQLAIADLLVSDTFYRVDDFQLRNKYVALMESVVENGGKIFKFSALHVSGEQLNLYTGIAATLRFPIPEIAEEEEDSEDEEEEESGAKDCADWAALA